LQDSVELSRGAQEFQLRLLAVKIAIQVGHPFFVFVEPRAFHIAKIRLALAKLRLQDAYILLRQLQFQTRHLFRRIRFLHFA